MEMEPEAQQPASPQADDGEIPLEHPAFESFPMLEMEPEGAKPAELDLAPQEAAEPSLDSVSYSPIDGAGEELDLEEVEEDEFYMVPSEIRGMVPAAASSVDAGYGADVLVERQLPAVESQESVEDPDFYGTLFSRTVTKVLFRFFLVSENGLLCLTGPQPTGEQAELCEWLRQIILRSGASPTTPETESRTCEIHLMDGQPHLASADRSEEALVAYLIRNDIISKHRVEMVIKGSPHRRPISALLSAGTLSPLRVSRHVTSFVLSNVLDTFSWSEGDFAFYRGKTAPDESFPTGQSAMGLILQGISRLPESLLDSTLSSLIGYHVVANETPPASIELFQLDQEQMSIFQSLASARPLDDALTMCMPLAEPLKVKQTLYLLIECEMVSLV
jgi:hypothetical protein